MGELDIAMLILRVWAGVVMVAHGVNHARSLDGTAKWFGSVGFRSPRLNAWLSAVNEIVIGVALIVGLVTAISAAALVATMFIAFWTIHRTVGFFVFHRPDEGYEYVATLAVIALALAIVGPGNLSIDAALGISDDLSGTAGAVIYGLGIVAGVGQLALFWRQPEETE